MGRSLSRILSKINMYQSARFVLSLKFVMDPQDIVTIAILLLVVLFAISFPGGPGTPRRFKVPNFTPVPVPTVG